jgi:hypothetical protein
MQGDNACTKFYGTVCVIFLVAWQLKSLLGQSHRVTLQARCCVCMCVSLTHLIGAELPCFPATHTPHP